MAANKSHWSIRPIAISAHDKLTQTSSAQIFIACLSIFVQKKKQNNNNKKKTKKKKKKKNKYMFEVAMLSSFMSGAKLEPSRLSLSEYTNFD